MKEIALPASREAQQKKCASLRRTDLFLSVCVILFAGLAVLLALGVFVAVIVFEFRSDLENTLLYILVGAFAGGAIGLALGAFGLNVAGRRHRDKELDFRERCDGAESFFVGDGTLLTFGESGVVIHGENSPQKAEIRVPYEAMRFFSVCTRRAPREKGEWSVVFEIPARFLVKGGKGKADEKPALVQADAKPRLFASLDRRGLEVIGERSGGEEKKFTRLAQFHLPDRKKRRGALLMLLFCGVLAVAGVLIGVFWQPVVGAVVGAAGLFLGAKSVSTFVRAKGTLGVYEEGLFWRDTNRVDSVFLKWDEIVRVERIEGEGIGLYRVQCPYGAYHFPAVAGADEVLREKCPEKFGDDRD